jgi:twinkle protein
MAGTATFERDVLIDKITKGEVKDEINPDIYNEDIRPKDVIFGEDVKDRALEIFRNGYESVESTGVPELDYFFKFKRGEITLLSGIGNYGKSTMLKYLLLLKAIVSGNRFAFFTPEDNPAEEFYHDMTEIYLGCDCTKFNPNQPSEKTYKDAYDWISKHIFYIYPKDISPTPEYIKERFLELIIKEKVDGCVIDPFNQMDNNYNKTGRTDKYLETFLSDCTRFAQTNNVYFIIVAHPHKLKKEIGEKNYPCPDVYEIADGAMWNNKMDNILIYHRPNHQTEPDSPICELHTKKIRRQKTVGRKGIFTFELNRPKRRYIFDGKDYMAEYIYKDNSIPQAYSLRDMLEPLPLDQVPF